MNGNVSKLLGIWGWKWKKKSTGEINLGAGAWKTLKAYRKG